MYILTALTLTISAATGIAATAPPVDFYDGLTQVDGVAALGKSTTTIAFLGLQPSLTACEAAALSFPSRVWSFTYYAQNATSKLSTGCFGVLEPRWCPAPAPSAGTGRVGWPCRSDDDCSLNGACQPTGVCACRRAWEGATCATLRLRPGPRGGGFQPVDGGEPTSTWGGAVAPCAGGYCMVASEITGHCGIAAWSQNSRVVVARAASAGGAYARAGELWPVFSHEPVLAVAPTGEVVVFYTASNPPRSPACACVNGSTNPGACRAAGGGGGGGRRLNKDPSWMSWARDAAGPFSPGVQLWPDYVGADTNFAPLILANGSLVGMWRRWGGGHGGSRVFLATAPDWRNVSGYVQHREELFPDLGAAGTEDMMLYQDKAGFFHAVFHHMYGANTDSAWWLLAAGGHAFSRDGVSWTYTGVAWGNSTSPGYDAKFDDGTGYHFTRLERPFVVLNETDGDPAFLVNAAQYGTSQSASAANGGDASFTLVQPVAAA
jgi:hypothetical protein